MRLQELFETTEEDRALVSLSHALYQKLQPYVGVDPDYTDEDQELISLGKIGELFDTPLTVLNNVNIDLQGGEPFERRASGISAEDEFTGPEGQTLAMWNPPTNSIVFNLDYLDNGRLRPIITHELRHALDEYKSNWQTGQKYFTPKKKSHRKQDPYSDKSYIAQPAEINARFLEVLDILTNRIKAAYNLPPDQIKGKILTDFKNLLAKYKITELFPEGTDSPDYKRLLKRGYDYIQKEMNHIESELQKSGQPKTTQGSW